MGTAIRVLAVVLVAFALLPRGVARHERVLVVGLEGASLELIDRLAAEGALPELQRVLASGVLTRISGAGSSDRRGFWDTALGGVEPGLAPTGGASHVWNAVTGGGAEAVVVNFPGVEAGEQEHLTVLPGADEADGFIGDSIGSTVRLDRLQKQNVGWPYTTAATEIAEWAHMLSSGESSSWIGVRQLAPDDRHGVFRLYALDDETAYVSPVYRRTVDVGDDASAEPRIYVADDPAWALPARRIREYFARHAGDLAGDRGEAAFELAAGDWQLMVYMETLLQAGHYVYARERDSDDEDGQAVDDAGLLRSLYVGVDARIGELIEASGPETVVVIVGNEPVTGHEAGEGPPSGWIVVAGAPGERATSTSDVRQVAPTLRYLLGLPVERAETTQQPIKAVRVRYWHEPWRSLTLAARKNDVREIPFTASSLESLGLLTDTAHAPEAEDADGATDAADASVDVSR